ncbi:type II toxin-antitoxin system RelB/DinJ family antitoxin [uncultured Megasphaera sp.]|uniref:type II toxin-antitoxin system RelB/DinJ family antitoxin n=1 Tax=uncultured Megasphaera sp. TaxID=165188 RepID=UPI00266F0031|nr:type II toxin-antitoxin system RelB/DinJ family antitoxin [uncultured Megasphaera sp.]
MATTNVQIRMDTELKKETERVLKNMGFTFSAAINVFCRQVINQRRIPFDIIMNEEAIPNEETKKAMDDTMAGKNLSKTFSSVDEMWKELNA